MSRKMVLILLAVAVLEGMLIVGLILKPRGVVVRVIQEGYTIPSPLFWALEYDAPDKKFEELLKKDPHWATYRDPLTGWSALTDCVAAKRTNCVRMLIANGASFEKTLKEEKKLHHDGAVILLQQFQQELNKQ